MRGLIEHLIGIPGAGVTHSVVAPSAGGQTPGASSGYAEVNGTRLHYLTSGGGEPVLLLHGYAQTSHMWRPLIAELASDHTVIAPDLRGVGRIGARRRAATTRKLWPRTSAL